MAELGQGPPLASNNDIKGSSSFSPARPMLGASQPMLGLPPPSVSLFHTFIFCYRVTTCREFDSCRGNVWEFGKSLGIGMKKFYRENVNGLYCHLHTCVVFCFYQICFFFAAGDYSVFGRVPPSWKVLDFLIEKSRTWKVL